VEPEDPDVRFAARPGAGDDLITPVAVEVAAGSDLDAAEEIGSIGEETGHLGDDRAGGVELEGLHVRAAAGAGACDDLVTGEAVNVSPGDLTPPRSARDSVIAALTSGLQAAASTEYPCCVGCSWSKPNSPDHSWG
jgi:hypothetical protein